MPDNSESLPSSLPVIIIGAGPAGLTAAYELTQHGIPSVIVERDSQVGGLARTIWFRGYGFDIGGHRFFTKVPRIQETWKELLGEDFIRVPRLSRIYYRERFFNYPLKPMNALFGLGVFTSLLVLASYLWRKLRPLPEEEFFEPYVINRFGDRLYRTFFKTYTEKVWGIPCTGIRSDWAAQRIKGLCLTKAVKNAFTGEVNGNVKSLIDEFDYPRLGPGMLWQAMESRIINAGNVSLLNREVIRIMHDNADRITGIAHVSTTDPDDMQTAEGAYYLGTMPLRTMLQRMDPAPPDDVVKAAEQLRYRDLITVNLILDGADLFPDNWIYVHSPAVKVGRIQNFGNWSKDLVPEKGHSAIGMEYFCFENDELWQLSDDALLEFARTELDTLGLTANARVKDGFVLRIRKAYPMYDEQFSENLEIVRAWIGRFSNFQQMGRNGLHRYNNQDHSMLTAMLAVDNLLHNMSHDIWQVNVDNEYQEFDNSGAK